jgi:hypothetical protein
MDRSSQEIESIETPSEEDLRQQGYALRGTLEQAIERASQIRECTAKLIHLLNHMGAILSPTQSQHNLRTIRDMDQASAALLNDSDFIPDNE